MDFDVIESDPTNYDELKTCSFDDIIEWFSSALLPCVGCKQSCGTKVCKDKIKRWLLRYDQSF